MTQALALAALPPELWAHVLSYLPLDDDDEAWEPTAGGAGGRVEIEGDEDGDADPPLKAEEGVGEAMALLSYALVNRAFRELTARIALIRSGYGRLLQLERDFPLKDTDTELVLSPGALSSLAHHLPASFAATGNTLTRLACTVGPRGEAIRQTRAIGEAALLLPVLERLDLAFEVDPFLAPAGSGEGSQSIRRTILDSVCTTLARLAGRSAGGTAPVFIVFAGEIFSCRAGDIRLWRLDRFRYHESPGWRPSLARRRKRALNDEYPTDYCNARYHTGSRGSLPTLRQLDSLSLQLIPASHHSFVSSGKSGSDAFSILTFNASDMTYLRLGRYHSGAHPSIFPRLRRLLPCLVLPELRALCIYDEFIPPAALRAFLVAQIKLELLDYHAPIKALLSPRPAERRPDPARPLLSAPLAHPTLNSVRLCTTHFRTSAGHILPQLVAGPRLTFVELLFSATTLGARAGTMIADLQALAGRDPALPRVTLNLVDSAPSGWDLSGRLGALRRRLQLPRRPAAPRCWAETPGALAVAPALQCVHTVWVAPLSYAAATRILPFLARLPALAHVSVGFTVKHLDPWEHRQDGRPWAVLPGRRRKKTRAAVERAVERYVYEVVRKGLPNVPSVVHVVWD
ncbi:hypothetical protein MIND_00646600 [Mycena indigotica]|uniref:F-box domain-containing protein n=1 Tax=Mycena indigotica TaxID=2126181 RepID=A0A8H6W9H8_9AGAR|nr:uncharacterized protein MIND_00646600 [Mycena indigotica]KAF7304149.1 hypothetical protein MIND_00646600 [Mycena indigotica]